MLRVLGFFLADSSQAKPNASSLAARAAVIPSLGSPRSSLFLCLRWLRTQLPSRGSSALPKLKVQPVRGSAVLFYNMRRDGSPSTRHQLYL